MSTRCYMIEALPEGGFVLSKPPTHLGCGNIQIKASDDMGSLVLEIKKIELTEQLQSAVAVKPRHYETGDYYGL